MIRGLTKTVWKRGSAMVSGEDLLKALNALGLGAPIDAQITLVQGADAHRVSFRADNDLEVNWVSSREDKA